MTNRRPPYGLLAMLKHASLTLMRKLYWGPGAADPVNLPDPREDESRRRGFEIVDTDTRKLAILCFSLLIVVALSMLLVAKLYETNFNEQSNVFGAGFKGGATQGTSIEETWQAIDANTATHLDEYRWVDKQLGVVQIPLNQAMDLFKEQEAQP